MHKAYSSEHQICFFPEFEEMGLGITLIFLLDYMPELGIISRRLERNSSVYLMYIKST